jgi:UPF0042 nucleotide-binding protein
LSTQGTSDLAEAWLLTGMSGAGKATALAALEAAGAVVTDNLSPALLQAWASQARLRPAAAVVDARHGAAVADLVPPAGVRVLYLDAGDAVLLRRLGESTRRHPCAESGTPLAAIRRERELLAGLRAAADAVIDTTESDPAELAARVTELVAPGSAAPPFHLLVSSFGYKFGAELEADWMVDVRFLRNPFWEPELRDRTGLDDAVRRYVLQDPRTMELCDRLIGLLGWVVAGYADHRRRLLHVAVGCTGGRHRSVVVAEELSRRLGAEGVRVSLRHRDLAKPDPR